MDTEKIAKFFLYAKQNNYDASICLYDGKLIAIINPVDRREIFEGSSIVDVMDEKESLILNKINEAITDCGKKITKR